MSHKISFGLSSREIQEARNQLELYKKELDEKCRLFALRLANEGIFIARTKIGEMNAVYSGELLQSIQIEFDGNTLHGVRFTVFTNCEYAKYVEFGTGVVGSENPHPNTSIVGWKYDVNSHGEAGWIYTDKDGKTHWTKGMKSRPFMWETANELRLQIESIAREIFK